MDDFLLRWQLLYTPSVLTVTYFYCLFLFKYRSNVFLLSKLDLRLRQELLWEGLGAVWTHQSGQFLVAIMQPALAAQQVLHAAATVRELDRTLNYGPSYLEVIRLIFR